MSKKAIAWGASCIAAGILLATNVLPGANQWATGPRVGLVMMLLTLGTLILGIRFAKPFLQRTTKTADYQSTCPVGASCPQCDAFNFKPRVVCRVCSTDLGVAEVSEASRDGSTTTEAL